LKILGSLRDSISETIFLLILMRLSLEKRQLTASSNVPILIPTDIFSIRRVPILQPNPIMPAIPISGETDLTVLRFE